MAYTNDYSMKLNRKGLNMEDLFDDELDIMILVELYDPEDIEVEISTAF